MIPAEEAAAVFVRAFVAVPLASEVRAGLAQLLETLQRAGGHVAWVRPENLHVSLAFLGNIKTEEVAPVAMLLDLVAGDTAPSAFDTVTLGAFGGPDSPRVVWAGVHPTGPLMALQSRLAVMLRDEGFPIEERAYTPHVTLGRVRSARRRHHLVEAMAAHRDAGFGRSPFDRLLLMKSTLAPEGAHYDVLHTAFLRPAP